MKLLIALALTVTLLSVNSMPAASPEVLSVAVFDFESRDEPVRDLGPKVATLLNANLSVEPDLITVERAELEKVLGEQELSLSGTISSDTAAKVSQLTGAKVLVTGRIFRVEKDLVIVAKIIGTETSRVYGEIVKGPGSSALTDMVEDLAKKIAKTVTEKGGTLVAKTRSKEERIEKIVKSLKEGKRPAVLIKIPELHFGTPVVDPAAETELSLILQKAGFTVLDENSKEKADLEITGEAFSALAMRKGNLISCRARVEIKTRDLASGRIVASERQTSVGVDLTEQNAAKSALENAALELAERFVAKLVR